jgi:hypothetical protein
MSDGITDAYREARVWEDKWDRFKRKLKEQDAEELFCKVRHVQDIADGHWRVGPGSPSDSLNVYRAMFKDGVDLKALFIAYLDKVMEALDKDWSTVEGQELKISDSYGCYILTPKKVAEKLAFDPGI